MRHPFLPATLALSISTAIAGFSLPGAALAATANSDQFWQDLATSCIDPTGGTGNDSGTGGDNSNAFTLQPATVDAGSNFCAQFERQVLSIEDQFANDPTAMADAFAQLAAEITPDEMPALYTSLVQLSTDQIRNVSHHLRNHRYLQNNSSSDAALNDVRSSYIGGSAGEQANRLSFFVDGSKVDGSQDDTTYEVGYDLGTDHYTLGADYRFSDSLIAGFAFGNSDTTLEYSEAQNQTDNDTDHYIVYASWYRDNFAVDYIVGYAKGEFDTQRKILDSTAVGNTDNELAYLNIAGSYDFVSGGLTYGPFASYDYLDGSIDNFEETNGGGWEAAFDDQDVKSQIYTVGGHASYAMSFGWGVLVPHARAEWRNELEDERDLIVGRFVQDPVSSFAITPDEPDSDWYQVSAGISAQFAHGIAAFLDYEEVLEYEDTDLSIVTLGARWEM
ncbi:MAG: autotransporter outer membrane beta-barrel domain-containing protein [Gammaproteobacteria bacterium]|nr:autotransporter outer membrane beta-barrel domain-containing protein [Gammaproteobacteria bacterium]